MADTYWTHKSNIISLKMNTIGLRSENFPDLNFSHFVVDYVTLWMA